MYKVYIAITQDKHLSIFGVNEKDGIYMELSKQRHTRPSDFRWRNIDADAFMNALSEKRIMWFECGSSKYINNLAKLQLFGTAALKIEPDNLSAGDWFEKFQEKFQGKFTY